MITHCATCNAVIFREHRGWPRQYCNELCRRLADSRRKTSRAAAKKAIACAICGSPITQPARGRSRKLCYRCHPPVNTALNSRNIASQAL